MNQTLQGQPRPNPYGYGFDCPCGGELARRGDEYTCLGSARQQPPYSACHVWERDGDGWRLVATVTIP